MSRPIAILTTTLMLLAAGAAHGAPRLNAGPVGYAAGEVTIPITLVNDKGSDVASVAVDIGYDASALEKPAAVPEPAVTVAGKKAMLGAPRPGLARLGIIGFNTTALGNGVVAVVTFPRKAGKDVGPLNFSFLMSAAAPDGSAIPLERPSGILTVK